MATTKKAINLVLAEALNHFMGEEWSNVSLAKASGVAESTIRNYRSPEKRVLGASGKAASAKLTELASIAQAMGLEVADLLTDRSRVPTVDRVDQLVRQVQSLQNDVNRLISMVELLVDAPARAPAGPKRGRKARPLTAEQLDEAAKLRALWQASKSRLAPLGLASQEAFGAKHGIGNQAAVGFFLNGKTALSPKAAAAFARGLGCQVADFSPRLAALLAVPTR